MNETLRENTITFQWTCNRVVFLFTVLLPVLLKNNVAVVFLLRVICYRATLPAAAIGDVNQQQLSVRSVTSVTLTQEQLHSAILEVTNPHRYHVRRSFIHLAYSSRRCQWRRLSDLSVNMLFCGGELAQAELKNWGWRKMDEWSEANDQ